MKSALQSLRPELRGVAEGLLARAAKGEGISLDAIGLALGVLAVSQDEIESIFLAIEGAGRKVEGPSGGGGEAVLQTVLAIARALRLETGRAPTPPEIAARAGLDVERVRHALALARVIAK